MHVMSRVGPAMLWTRCQPGRACWATTVRHSRSASSGIAVERQSLLEAYDAMVESGALRQDMQQRRVAKKLSRLSQVLEGYSLPPARDSKEAVKTSSKLAVVFKHCPLHRAPKEEQEAAHERSRTAQVPRGLYIHGKVGTGKSLLMDLFFRHCAARKKRRVHFHEFMLEVHTRIHKWKQHALDQFGRSMHVDLRPERNAIVQVAAQIAEEANFLCFDEFQVTDIADAVIILRLFNEMWQQGVVMVATSNRQPSDLYKEGLNRHNFLPFIDMLERHCVVVDMESKVDHRQVCHARADSYISPITSGTSQQLDDLFVEMAGGRGEPTKVPVMMNRMLSVREARAGVARFTYEDLCAADVFAADYKAITNEFHTVFLENVRRMSLKNHDEARRFITLIDILYEAKTRVVISAEAPASELFSDTTKGIDGDGLENELTGDEEELGTQSSLASVRELAFAFLRASSRLTEMMSEEYLERHFEDCKHIHGGANGDTGREGEDTRVQNSAVSEKQR